MGRACSICTSEYRAAIDRELVGGQPDRGVAGRYGLSREAVRRHRLAHVSPALARVAATREHRRARSLLGRVEALADKAEAILAAAESDGSRAGALAALVQVRESLRLLGQVSGQLKPDGSTTVQVLNLESAPEWVAARTALLDALGPYPEARLAVVEALRRLPGYDAAPVRPGRAYIVPWRPGDLETDPEDQGLPLLGRDARYNGSGEDE